MKPCALKGVSTVAVAIATRRGNILNNQSESSELELSDSFLRIISFFLLIAIFRRSARLLIVAFLDSTVVFCAARGVLTGLSSDEVICSCSARDSLPIADFVRVEFLRASKGFA